MTREAKSAMVAPMELIRIPSALSGTYTVLKINEYLTLLESNEAGVMMELHVLEKDGLL